MERLNASDGPKLRTFGLALAVLILCLFVLVGPWLFGRARPGWPWWAAAGLGSLALIWPRALYPLYRVWDPVARLLGWLNSWLILGCVFFGFVWPLGWYARRARKLHYTDGFDPDLPTYRLRRDRARPVTDLTKPY
jgi:hypothetical protein